MWHPEDEAQACSDLAAFVEWRRATAGDTMLDPDMAASWHVADPSGFAQALQAFGGDAVTAEGLFAQWERIRPPV